MERNEKMAVSTPHQLISQDRQSVELTGVSDVDSFDETLVIAYTTLGELTIRGKGLHVKRLNVADGSLAVEGHIDEFSYSDVKKGGFLSRLLR